MRKVYKCEYGHRHGVDCFSTEDCEICRIYNNHKIKGEKTVNIKPLRKNILVQEIEESGGEMRGGIFIPDNIETAGNIVRGKVLKVGESIIEVKEGDIVFYRQGKRKSIRYGDGYLFILDSEDLEAVEV